jgi:arsenite methyltransferase
MNKMIVYLLVTVFAGTVFGLRMDGSLATNDYDENEDAEVTRQRVKAAYTKTVNGGINVLRDQTGGTEAGDINRRAELLGYEQGEVVESADLGLGCGNPMEVANLQPGEHVVDLGSGAGIDCFLAGKHVGEKGRVIGIDMTKDMILKANAARDKENMPHVEFRHGEIERMPITSAFADCVISNCVINLSPEKVKVYKEMARVLKPGGRISISDVMRERDLPQSLKTAESHSC